MLAIVAYSSCFKKITCSKFKKENNMFQGTCADFYEVLYTIKNTFTFYYKTFTF